MKGESMRTCGFVTSATVGLSLAVGCLLVGAAPASASEPPPVILHNPRPLVRLSPGQSYTFKASAQDASLVKWVFRPPGSTTLTLYNGVDTTTKRGVLKSSFTVGPFTASENGWQVGAVFINDPTGVPSGIQESDTTPGVVVLKTTPKG
jgi:hypothetical protein